MRSGREKRRGYLRLCVQLSGACAISRAGARNMNLLLDRDRYLP